MDVLEMHAGDRAFDAVTSLLRVIGNPQAAEAIMIEIRDGLKKVAEARAAIAQERAVHDAKMAADRAEVADDQRRTIAEKVAHAARVEAFNDVRKMIAEGAARIESWERQHDNDDGFGLPAGVAMSRAPSRKFVMQPGIARLIVEEAEAILASDPEAPTAPHARRREIETFGSSSLTRETDDSDDAAGLRPRAAGLNNRRRVA